MQSATNSSLREFPGIREFCREMRIRTTRSPRMTAKNYEFRERWLYLGREFKWDRNREKFCCFSDGMPSEIASS
jgi:hypothetical protein